MTLQAATDRKGHDPVAAVGRFVAGFAHQVRSPLTGIMGYGELLGQDTDPEERARWRRRMQGGLEELDLLIEGIQRYRVPTEIRLGVLPAASLVDEAWRLAQRVTPGAARKRNSLSTRIPKDMSLQVDAYHFRNLLTNLFQNAIDASPVGGRIRVIVGKGKNLVRVIDQGQGLRGISIEEITQPFFTTHANRAGLGLSVATMVAESHQLSLHWEERKTGGLCVSVRTAESRNEKENSCE